MVPLDVKTFLKIKALLENESGILFFMQCVQPVYEK